MPEKKPRIPRSFYGRTLPETRDTNFSGRLFVVEGADGAGRSTQIAMLGEWLEGEGYAVRYMKLSHSELVGEELLEAKGSNVLTATTMSLFYATAFFDQIIHQILPALRAGQIVLADRYIYTLIARDSLRGADPNWVRNVYNGALVPDAVFYLKVSARKLVQRNFQKNPTLDYWESGMDLGLSRDMFDSFIRYQRLLLREFQAMSGEVGFEFVNANGSPLNTYESLRGKIAALLNIPERVRKPRLVETHTEPPPSGLP
jgi:dTMP kinase